MMSREELAKCRIDLLRDKSKLEASNADLLHRAQEATRENGELRLKIVRKEFEIDVLFRALDVAAR